MIRSCSGGKKYGNVAAVINPSMDVWQLNTSNATESGSGWKETNGGW